MTYSVAHGMAYKDLYQREFKRKRMYLPDQRAAETLIKISITVGTCKC
jgi:hypothetical protein